MKKHITALVVTYNRKNLLALTLDALCSQSLRPDSILIVDNASTDGTCAYLKKNGWLEKPGIELLSLSENTGGSGGFSEGLAYAIKSGADWIWLMDDDAVPSPDALKSLFDVPPESTNIYGSIAIDGKNLSWPMMAYGEEESRSIKTLENLKPQESVEFLPFLGFLIHRETVKKIGFPDADFFIAADDMEYSYRARSAGADVILVTTSFIKHPPSKSNCIKFPRREFHSLVMPPWKRYYDVRNRLFFAKKYYSRLDFYRFMIPGSFLRLLVTLTYETQRFKQFKAFVAGMLDGLRDRKGRRHELWHL